MRASHHAAAGWKPLAMTHAEFLVSSYGKVRALQIAEVNSTVNGKDAYWLLVLQALLQLNDAQSAGAQTRG